MCRESTTVKSEKRSMNSSTCYHGKKEQRPIVVVFLLSNCQLFQVKKRTNADMHLTGLYSSSLSTRNDQQKPDV